MRFVSAHAAPGRARRASAQDPRAIDSSTAMPDVDVNERDAHDIAAYLLLRRRPP
jgi:hypothetical protein